MRKRWAGILAVILAVSLLAGCSFLKSDKQLIQERLETFTAAYNSGDLEKTLKCFDAKTRNTYQALFGVGDGIISKSGFGIELSDLWSLGVAVMSEGDAITLTDVEISIRSSTRATVHATMSFQQRDGGYSQEVTLTMVKEDGNWYIYQDNLFNF